MADPLFTLDNWLPMEPTPRDFISPPITVWNYPTKKDRKKQYLKEYNIKNKEIISRKKKEQHIKNRERRAELARQYRIENKEIINKKRMIDAVKSSELVINHYSNNLNECACCGVKNSLTIDHINGGGESHRKIVGTGRVFYRWLIKNNFPEGFQVLCFLCNSSKNKGTHCKRHHSKDSK